MRYVVNPTSGEYKACTHTEARRLLRYGWRKASKAEYNEALREYAQWLIRRELKGVPVRLH